ncbi:TetR/AcrR family transcriptional regulator [Klebsiella variicola]|uniref:TetR/AcrR family transcriptional regulator n=1 Tax=Klebsiella variicola TaxID=244366 RepID=UPI0035B5D9AA
MTALRLQEAALARFALQGFDATTMSEIASDVGIKKPSIYTHFSNKDELFLSLVPLVINKELEHARSTFRGGSDIKLQLRFYLKGIQKRYEESHSVGFWIRNLFMPPTHLYEAVMKPLHTFMDELENIIRMAIAQSPLISPSAALNAETLALTFMSMIDSLQSELLYGGPEKYQRRLEATWEVFEIATRYSK